MMRLSAIAVLVLLPSLGCNQGELAAPTNETATVETTPAAFNVEGKPTVEYDVPAMHCEDCSAAACSLLEEMPGVVDVQADFETKLATVAVDEGQFDREAGRAALEEQFGEATVVDKANEAADASAGEANTDEAELPASDTSDGDDAATDEADED